MAIVTSREAPRLLEASPPGPERASVAEFQKILTDIGQIEVFNPHLDMEAGEPVPDATNRFLLARQHTRGGVNLYIHPDNQELIGTPQVTFAPRESRSFSSAHGVVMGDLFFGTGHTVPVAVKPQRDNPEWSAVNEYLNHVAVGQLGLRTVEPFGVLLGGEIAYSFTHLEESLSTLDSIAWRSVMADENNSGDLLGIWSSVARQTALVHAIGVSHGDLAPRNIATLPDDGGVFLLDWESSRVRGAKPRDAEVRFNLSFADLKELLESMIRTPADSFKAGIGILGGTMEDQWLVFKHLVFDEYVATRIGYESGKDAAEVRDELTELETSLWHHLRWVNHSLGYSQQDS